MLAAPEFVGLEHMKVLWLLANTVHERMFVASKPQAGCMPGQGLDPAHGTEDRAQSPDVDSEIATFGDGSVL